MSTVEPTTAWGTVGLVAGREITTRMRSKAYLWTTGLLLAAVVLGGVLLNLAQGSPSAKVVGLTPATASLAGPLRAAATASGTDLRTRDVTDDAGQAEIRSGDLDALLVAPPTTAHDGAFTVVVHEDLDPSLQGVLTALRQQSALSSVVTGLGGDPMQVDAQLAAATLDVHALEPQPEHDGGQIIAGYVAGILLFISLQTCAQLVAQGVVEEKTSRVVELLLATIRPWQLMAGKVVGIGVVGLVQVAVVVAGGVATATALGLVDASSINLGATAAWALVWFVLGFVTYATAIGALASLVSRQEDVGSVTGPVVMLMIVPYIIGISIAPWNPDSPLVQWLSYLPFTAPMVMPIRIALGAVETWQVLAAVVASAVVIPVLVWLGGRIYSNAVLRTGARVRLRDALRSA